ncbi:hypothetical protein COI_0668 [Mannheimia haemolytica serotype A2 str. OVINE]|nr:hypothetical protein COI_0668 [Mannheimia haemolytica serotype A2 str. OVINE]
MRGLSLKSFASNISKNRPLNSLSAITATNTTVNAEKPIWLCVIAV